MGLLSGSHSPLPYSELKRARRHCLESWKQLGLKRGCSLADIHEAVETFRDRPVEILEQTPDFFADLFATRPHLETGRGGLPSGVWVDGGDVDHVYHRPASPLGAANIICHEFGHMLLGHEPTILVNGQGVMRRTAYNTETELHAELFATLAVDFSSVATLSTRTVRGADPALLHRLSSTMEG